MIENFPKSLDEVTPDWLTAVLNQQGVIDGNQGVERFDVLPIGSGFGQTGESARLKLHYAAAGMPVAAPATLFAKFATKDEIRRHASQRLGLYSREVDFYNRLARQAKVRVPHCYFAMASTAGDYATLLLEDFPEHRPGDDITGLSPADAGLATDLLCDLHGPFWGRGKQLGVQPLNMGDHETFTRAWAQLEANFGDMVPPAVRAVKAAYLNAIQPLHDWLIAGETTLGHGDLKLDNLLFNAGEDPIVAVDWQAVRPQKGMRDLAYTISHSMNVEDRRTHEKNLLQRYVNGLAKYGVAYPLHEAEEDYRKSMLFDFCTVLYIVGVNINSNERAMRRKKVLMERAVTALLDWQAFDLLSQFQ